MTICFYPDNNIQLVEEQKFLEYEREMQKLKKQYEDEYLSKCQMEADFQNLKKQYEAEVSRLHQLVRYLTINQ